MTATSVSVCVPTFNGDRYLRECLDSILAQTYSNFELLLVDDCSSDGTDAIARSYCALDSRVRYTRNDQNLGLVRNWNRCVELARGEWIKFVFQDDLVAANCLERMLSQAGGRRALIACRRNLVFEPGTSEEVRQFYDDHQSTIDDLIAKHDFIPPEECQKLALQHIGYNLFGEPSAVMLHHSFFNRFGFFNPALIMLCDSEYWTRVSIHTGAIYVGENLASFRVHSGATSAENFSHREYRTKLLDKLIILHEYLYSASYQPIRRQAHRLTPKVDVKALFRRARQEAYAAAYWARKDTQRPDASLMEEHNDVSLKYPKIAFGSISRLAWLLKIRLSKLVQKAQ